MALTRTTLASAVAVDDTSIVVASATGFAAGSVVKVDQEVMVVQQNYLTGVTIPVRRGQGGTLGTTHASAAGVVVGSPSAGDFVDPGPGMATNFQPAARARVITSYSAAGAITLPVPGSDAVAILNGTSALAMTIANPTTDNDGDILIIVGNGKAAHTITYTAGWGNAGSGADVGTFDTGGQCCMQLIAANAIWVPLPSPFSGTLTAFDVASA